MQYFLLNADQDFLNFLLIIYPHIATSALYSGSIIF